MNVVAELHEVDATFSTYRADSAVSRIGAANCDLDGRRTPSRGRRPVRGGRSRGPRTRSALAPRRPARAPAFEPTGLVKGWAVEDACRRLSRRLPAYDVLVDAGGDVALACRRTDTPDWTVGIEDPRDTSRLLATLPLRSGGVATSGSAARGAHVLDPRSGEPGGDGLLSVTVVGPSLLWADVYATAAFARGADADGWLATLPGHVALVVAEDGTTRTVTGS